MMSDTKIDLTQRVLRPGVSEFHMRAVWAAIKMIVPPGDARHHRDACDDGERGE